MEVDSGGAGSLPELERGGGAGLGGALLTSSSIVKDVVSFLEKLQSNCDSRSVPDEGATMEASTQGGPMTSAEISRLYRELLRLRDDGSGIAACPPEALLAIIPHLQAHIRCGTELNLITAAAAALQDDRELDLNDWMKYNSEGSTYLQQTIMAIEAAAAALVIMTAEEVDRRLVMQELMEETVQLLKHQVNAHLVPAFDPSSGTFPSAAASAAAAAVTSSEEEDAGAVNSDSDEEEGDMNEAKSSRGRGRGKGNRGGRCKSKSVGGRRRSSTGGGTDKDDPWRRFAPVLQHLSRTTTKIHELLDLFEALIMSIRVDDPLLLTITPVCLTTLAIDPGVNDNLIKLQPIQHSAISLMQVIFGIYEQHRSLILEDVFGLLLKLPVGKRHLRTFRLHYRAITMGAESQNIQMITALIMLLLQGVVCKPQYVIVHMMGGGRIGADRIAEELKDKPLEGEECVVSVAHTFAQSFLDRCGKKESGAEYRTLLGNFIDDLLMALLLPEWPAAEMLLHCICILLLKDLYHNKGSTAESIYFLHSLDILGKVLSRLRDLSKDVSHASETLSKALGEELKRAVEEGGSLDDDDGSIVTDWFRRVISGKVGQFTIRSEEDEDEEMKVVPRQTPKKKKAAGKKRKLAATIKSIGSDDDDAPPASRRRSNTRAVQATEEEIEEVEEKEEEEEEEEEEEGTGQSESEHEGGGSRGRFLEVGESVNDHDVAQQLVLNYLSHRAQKGESWLRYARWVFLSRWVSDSANEKDLRRDPKYWAFLDSQWDAPSKATLQEDLYHVLSTEAVVHLSHCLLLSRQLLQSFEKLLFRLLALLGQGQAAWRARVIKAFGGILECDPMLMVDNQVKQAVIDRFQDEATSVRQATVDLVGKYVLQKPELFEAYYDALIERLVDKGVSVRKTVVKLFGEFLQRLPNHRLRTEICRRLVERASIVKEEDTVKDLIQDTFQGMWFSELSAASAAAAAAAASAASSTEGGGAMNGGGAAAANGHHGLGRSAHVMSDKDLLASVGLQMVEVIAGLSNTDWLVCLLTNLLFGPGEGEQEKKDRVKQRKTVTKRCAAIVESLINVLLELDEGGTPPLNSRIPELANPAKQLLAVISTLHVFSRANPRFLLEHVDTLLPYLKGENHLSPHEEASICSMISQMVALVISHLNKPDRAMFSQVTKDLVQITYRFGTQAIHAAVQCLANICTYISHDASSIINLANTFYRVLKKFRNRADFTKEDYTTRSSAHRALVVLGCCCRYYTFKAPVTDSALPAGAMMVPLADELSGENIYEMSYRVLSHYLSKDVETETKAIQSICCLFSGCMQLMLTAQRDHLIGKMLTGRASSVKLQALRSLKEVLLAEETRVESGAARENMAKSGVTLKQRVKGDQDAEASIVGGVIQEHLEAIKVLLFDADVHLRSAAIALLSVLHRQGLVNPLQTLPTLIALQGDPSASVRGQAYRQLLIENEKHPEFLPARVLDGVCLCYTFQNRSLGQINVNLDEKQQSGSNTTAGNGHQCIFGPMYASCIRTNRKHRYTFLRNLLSLFEEKTARDVHNKSNAEGGKGGGGAGAAEGGGGGGKKPVRRTSSGVPLSAAAKGQKGSLDPGFLAFLTQVLAYMPFDVQEEPLFVVYHISRLVSLEGSALLSELKKLFARVGVKMHDENGGGGASFGGGGVGAAAAAVGHDDSDSDSDLDLPTSSASARGGGGREAMDVDGDEDEDEDGGGGMQGGELSPALLAELKDKCAVGMAFCLLLRLKFFLKQVYSLNDQKLLEYKPQEGNAKTERLLSKPDSLPDLDIPDNLIINLNEEGQEAGALLRSLVAQFKLFKKLIRQDPSDFKLHQVVKRGGGRRSSAASNGGAAAAAAAGGASPAAVSRGGGRGRGRGKGGGRGGGGGRRKVVNEYEGESSSEDESDSSSGEEML